MCDILMKHVEATRIMEQRVETLEAASAMAMLDETAAQKDDLTALIKKSDNKVAELAKAIAKIEDDVARLANEQKEATANRAKEHAQLTKAYNKKSDGKIADLAKAVGKLEVDVARIGKLENEFARLDTEHKETTVVRAKEHAELAMACNRQPDSKVADLAKSSGQIGG